MNRKKKELLRIPATTRHSKHSSIDLSFCKDADVIGEPKILTDRHESRRLISPQTRVSATAGTDCMEFAPDDFALDEKNIDLNVSPISSIKFKISRWILFSIHTKSMWRQERNKFRSR